MTGPLSNYECPTLRGPVPMVPEKQTAPVICKRVVTRKPHAGLQGRIENTKRLIAEFRTREMTRKDVMEFFGFRPNGAGRYLNDLMGAEIIEIARLTESNPYTPGRPVYWLTATEDKISAFLAVIASPTVSTGTTKKDKSGRTRTLHVMHDDAYFKVKMHRAPAAPDPLALPEGFFKPVRIDGEPLQRTQAAQVARSSFPVPNSAAFVVPT